LAGHLAYCRACSCWYVGDQGFDCGHRNACHNSIAVGDLFSASRFSLLVAMPALAETPRALRCEREEGEASPSGSREASPRGSEVAVRGELAGGNEDAEAIASGIARGVEIAMKRIMKKKGGQGEHRSWEDSEEETDVDVHKLLGVYNLNNVDVLEMPDAKVVDKHLAQAAKQKASGRKPIIDAELTKAFVSVRDKDSEWVKAMDVASLNMAQFSALWWRRAMLQLTAQASTRSQTFSMGDLVNRWVVLSRIACEESVRAAVQYDRATWGEAVCRIHMRDSSFRPEVLGRLQADPFAVVMRQKERAAAQLHQGPTQVRGRSRSPPPRSSRGQWRDQKPPPPPPVGARKAFWQNGRLDHPKR